MAPGVRAHAQRAAQPERPASVHVLDGGPEPQAILDREQDDRGDLDREESRAETRLERGHRFEHDRDHIDEDERDEPIVDDPIREGLDGRVEELVGFTA
jgi:hypothetical protein